MAIDEVWIGTKYAESYAISRDRTVSTAPGLRVFRGSPFTILVQVRTSTAKQVRMSHVTITATEARELAAYLLRKADELRDDPGRKA